MSRFHQYCDTNTLYSGCPSCEANRKHTCYWYHANCGHKTCICHDDLHVFCSGCDANYIIFQWNFSCGSHGFRKIELQGLFYALSVLGTTYGRDDQIKKATQVALREYANYR